MLDNWCLQDFFLTWVTCCTQALPKLLPGLLQRRLLLRASVKGCIVMILSYRRQVWANSVDPDQTALDGTVCSGSTLFPFHQQLLYALIYEPRHDKTNKMSVRPAKNHISLGIHPVWSESLLSAERNLGSLATHWMHSEDSDQTGRMPRLIRVFAGRTHYSVGFVMSWLIW